MPGFDWDFANIQHIARHGLTPEQVEQTIQNDPIDSSPYLRNGEERLDHLGETDDGLVLVVVTTIRRGRIRVVTAHPANKTMRGFYAREMREHHGKDH